MGKHRGIKRSKPRKTRRRLLNLKRRLRPPRMLASRRKFNKRQSTKCPKVELEELVERDELSALVEIVCECPSFCILTKTSHLLKKKKKKKKKPLNLFPKKKKKKKKS